MLSVASAPNPTSFSRPNPFGLRVVHVTGKPPVEDSRAQLRERCRKRRKASGPATAISPIGAPLETVARNLIGTHDPAQLADRVRALGAEPRAALVLGSALASRIAFGEIVYYSLSSDRDRISRQSAAVGVFYTKRGRIVGAPSASPSGQLWTTLKPGSDHAIGQAISQLVELSADQWEAALV